MRMLLKIQVPTEDGNFGLKEGKFNQIIDYFQTEFKPEAIYFLAEDGKRTGLIFVDMKDPSQIPAMAEPWFQALNANIEMTPVMIPSDLQKAGSSIEKAIKTFGNFDTTFIK
ncbi:MAG: hypothetical protein ACHQJ6_09340 [Candidatus Berkiellales bacterium]